MGFDQISKTEKPGQSVRFGLGFGKFVCLCEIVFHYLSLFIIKNSTHQLLNKQKIGYENNRKEGKT